MKQRKRIYYSAAQRAEIWDRWRRGESMSSIGRRFDRESSSVFSVLSPSGGIRPPEQIAGWLKRSSAGQEQHRVSHETIHKSLYIQARGMLKKELLDHLRARRTILRSHHASLKGDGLGQSDRLASRTAPCPGTGRATSSRVHAAAMS